MKTSLRPWQELIRRTGFGTLSTISVSQVGFPFGSLVEYGPSGNGLLFFLSKLAEHTKNLRANPAVSLFIMEQHGSQSELERARVTLVGRAQFVPGRFGLEDYLRAHPSAQRYVELPDFEIYRFEVEAARFVGGFGQMGWLTPESIQELWEDV